MLQGRIKTDASLKEMNRKALVNINFVHKNHHSSDRLFLFPPQLIWVRYLTHQDPWRWPWWGRRTHSTRLTCSQMSVSSWMMENKMLFVWKRTTWAQSCFDWWAALNKWAVPQAIMPTLMKGRPWKPPRTSSKTWIPHTQISFHNRNLLQEKDVRAVSHVWGLSDMESTVEMSVRVRWGQVGLTHSWSPQ